jgi:radical SAM superfamily enzyme YgiQ (UPF0313 family)
MTVVSKDWHYPQVPPLGIAYLASCAREAGHGVTVVDGLGEAVGSFHEFIGGCFINGLSMPEVVARVPADTEAIGVSIMFSKQWPLVRRLLDELRAAFPSVPMIVGGEHVSATVQHVFDTSPIDYAVFGEGEETLLELLTALSTGNAPGSEELNQIQGLAYRSSHQSGQPVAQESEIVSTPSRKRRRELDSIPWPAWDLLPVADYVENNRFQDCSDRKVMIVMGTRGCPYQCRFCSSPQMWTTNFYMRSPKDLVDEIEHYIHTYGTTEFQFQDLTFVINRNWVIKVATEICERKLDITWKLPGGTRSEAFDAELFTKLAESGCTSLTFAPESGSKRVLAAMQKKADPDRFIEFGKIVRRNRIGVTLTTFIIIGSPEETTRDLMQTYAFIAKLALAGYDAMLCSRFTCYPGSDYHHRYLKEGLLEYNDDYFLDLDLSVSNLRNGRSWHPHWSEKRIRRSITLAYLLFFTVYYLSRPLRMFRSVSAVLRNQPRTRIEQVFAHGLMRRVRRFWKGFRATPTPQVPTVAA